MPNETYLSVIIPAYNEERRLPKTLREIDRYLSEQAYDYEILVVNDGSKDKTAEIVRGLSSEIANLRLIDNKVNRGKGYVVRQGLLTAQGKYRLFTDADNSTAMHHIERMWPWFGQGYSVVFGSRDIKGAILDPPQPWLRKVIFGQGFKLLRKIIIGLWEIKDTQCGFKCFTEKAAGEILPKCRIDRWAFDPEILVLAKRAGHKIKEIPVIWVNDPESKVKFKGMVKMLFDIFKIRWNLICGKYDKI